MTDNVDKLPEALRVFVNHLGITAATELLNEWGGRVIYIPDYPDHHHLSVQRFGLDIIKALAEITPNSYVQLPRSDKLLKRARNDLIIADARDLTMPELECKYQLTRQQIMNILNSCPGPNRPSFKRGDSDKQMDFNF